MNPATIALLLQAAIQAIPELVAEYEIAKQKGNYTKEQKDALDKMIQDFKSKPEWQED